MIDDDTLTAIVLASLVVVNGGKLTLDVEGLAPDAIAGKVLAFEFLDGKIEVTLADGKDTDDNNNGVNES